jgi:hypothetical protein
MAQSNKFKDDPRYINCGQCGFWYNKNLGHICTNEESERDLLRRLLEIVTAIFKLLVKKYDK